MAQYLSGKGVHFPATTRTPLQALYDLAPFGVHVDYARDRPLHCCMVATIDAPLPSDLQPDYGADPNAAADANGVERKSAAVAVADVKSSAAAAAPSTASAKADGSGSGNVPSASAAAAAAASSGRPAFPKLQFRSLRPTVVHKSQAEHAVALDLLEQMAPYHRMAMAALREVSGRTAFIYGQPFVCGEGQDAEFKAGHDVDSCRGHLFAGFENGMPAGGPKCVAAFANTDGGSVYVGIHDSGIVQGVQLSGAERDKFSRDLHHEFGRLFAPRIDAVPPGLNLYSLHFHPVRAAPRPAPLPARPAILSDGPARRSLPLELRRYIKLLEQTTAGLTQRLADMKVDTTDRFVVEIRVQKAPDGQKIRPLGDYKGGPPVRVDTMSRTTPQATHESLRSRPVRQAVNLVDLF